MPLPAGLLNVSVVQPVQRDNICINPSMEKDIVNWVAPGGGTTFTNGGTTLTRDNGPSGFARKGAWCLKGVTTGANPLQGVVYASTASGFTSGFQYSISFWIHNGGTSLQTFIGNQTGGANWGSVFIPGVNAWQKFTFSATPNANVAAANAAGTAGAVLVIRTGSPQAVTFYIDGVMFETGGASTPPSTYVDGDEDGCYWLGGWQASISRRSLQSTEGGFVTKIMPADTYVASLESQAGIGHAPVQNISLPRGLQGGATYQRTIRGTRQFTLKGKFSGTSLDNLMAKRDALLGLLKSDLTAQAQTTLVKLSTEQGTTVLNIRARYQSGLDWAGLEGFTMPVPLTMEAYEPFWYEDFDSGTRMPFRNTVNCANYPPIKKDLQTGPWSNLASLGATNGAVRTYAIDQNQNVYVGGDFTTIEGVAANRIAMYTPSTGAVVALGTGCNGIVRSIVIGPDGFVYVGGDFAAAGGVANTGSLARWDPVAGTWASITTTASANGVIHALQMDKSGNLFVGGNFTTINGVAANRIAYALPPSGTWTPFGTGANGLVRCLASSPDGQKMYLGGDFTACNAVAATNGLAFLSSGVFVSMGACNTGVYAMCFGPTGDLYIAGTFASQNSITGTKHVCRFNGAGFYAMAGGVDGTGAFALAATPQGVIYVGGDFDTIATGNALQAVGRLGIWTGSTWVNNDAAIPGNPTITALAVNSIQGFLYVGHNIQTGAAVPACNFKTVLLPGGGIGSFGSGGFQATGPFSAATSWPRITILGPGRLFSIANMTTGDAIYFNNFDLLAGERITLDLTPGNVTLTSSFRGNVFGMILPGSKISTWKLIAGANFLTAFMDSTTAASDMWLVWQNNYWAVDALL